MHTDFGAYRLDEDHVVVRTFGSEHTFTNDELAEYIRHLSNVRDGDQASEGEGYSSIPRYEPPARKGEGKVTLDSLFTFTPVRITRRI